MALVSAAVEEDGSGLRWGSGHGCGRTAGSGHGWEGENVNGILANPLPCLYRANMGSRRVISAPFRWSSEIGLLAFLHFIKI